MWPIVKIFSMSNCSIGSIIRASLGSPAAPALCNQSVRRSVSTAGAVRSRACRSHHIDHAGGKAEQNKHDEPPRRGRQQVVDPPADRRADDNAGDQLRREPEPARHRRGPGSSVSAFSSGLVSPDFAAVPNFGQPVIQISEPCGKRSFVRGRLIVISVSAAVRAFSHAVETRNAAAWMEMTPRHPQKPRGPYLPPPTKSRLRRNWLAY